jgi:acyl carrier protein
VPPETTLALASRISAILLEYAENPTLPSPLEAALSLKNDLGIDSYSLISIVIRLGDELGVDAVGANLELHRLETVGNLFELGTELERLARDAKAG